MLKIIRTGIAGALIVALLYAGTLVPAYAYVDYKLLSVNGVAQEQTNWCWAATTYMISNFLGHIVPTPSQSQIVTSVKGSPINDGATYQEDDYSLVYNGVTTSPTALPRTFSDIITDVNNNHPIKASIGWVGGNGSGHDYVIRGYYEDTSNSTQDVYYIDPLPNNPRYNIMNYSQFLNNSSFFWRWSYYNNY